MKTKFQIDWIQEQNKNTIQGYSKIVMLREKYDLMNKEIVWLDDWNNGSIMFVGNSYNYDILEKNKRGLSKVAQKIHNRFNSIKFVYFGHLLYKF